MGYSSSESRYLEIITNNYNNYILAFCGAAWSLGNNQNKNNTIEKVEEEEDKFNETYIKNKAKYIFVNLPDHCDYNDFKKSDSKAFSSEFYSLIDRNFKIKEEADESTFFDASDALAYWYRGNDSYRYNSNIFDEEKGDKMVVEQFDKKQAKVSIRYYDMARNGERGYNGSYIMILVYENDDWVIDNWIHKRETESYDKREELQEVINQ